MNAFQEKYSQEIRAILVKYPSEQKRSAVMPLLYLAMREEGFISRENVNHIAEIIDISPTQVGSISGFYTLFHNEPGGMVRIQVCNDLSCALRGADEFLEKLCDQLGIKVGETTEDGMVSIEAVKCLAACDHAPMFQAQTPEEIAYHHDQTVESALEVIEAYKKKGGGK